MLLHHGTTAVALPFETLQRFLYGSENTSDRNLLTTRLYNIITDIFEAADAHYSPITKIVINDDHLTSPINRYVDVYTHFEGHYLFNIDLVLEPTVTTSDELYAQITHVFPQVEAYDINIVPLTDQTTDNVIIYNINEPEYVILAKLEKALIEQLHQPIYKEVSL